MELRTIIRYVGVALILFLLFLLLHLYLKLVNIDKTKTPKPETRQQSTLHMNEAEIHSIRADSLICSNKNHRNQDS